MARYLNALWQQLQAQRDRWIFWIPVPVGAGIISYFALPSEPPLYAGVVAVFLVLPWLVMVRRRDERLFFVLLALFLIAVGFASAQWRTARVEAPVLRKESYPLTLEGRVLEVDPLPKASRILMTDLKIVKGKLWRDTLPERVRIKLHGNDPAVPAAGDIVQIKTVLMPLSGPVMPGAFDFQRHGYFRKLGATGYAIGKLTVVQRGENGDFFEKLRHAIRKKIEADVQDRQSAALLTAFIIGEEGGISEESWEIARNSGIAHLIAISGSHFILIAGFPFFLLRALLAAIPFIALRWPIKKIAAVAAMAVAVFYLFLIGAPIPAQRAVIMTCVVMTAIILDRDPFSLRLAAFAALVIFILSPESLIGPSFQLSFAAVVALISFYDATRGWWMREGMDAGFWKKAGLLMLACVATTAVANFATAPFALYHFSRVPLLAGLAANTIAVPIASFITFPSALASLVLMPLGMEQGALMIADKSLGFIMAIAREAASWEYGGFRANGWPAPVLAVIGLGFIWICFWKGQLRLLGFIPMVAAAVWIMAAVPRPDVLVSDNGKLFAVREADGRLWVSSLRAEKFTRESWLEREGAAGYEVWKGKNMREAAGFLSCAAEGCRYDMNGHRVLFPAMTFNSEKSCQDADIVIGTEIKEETSLCESAVVIGKWSLLKNGAYAIYLPEGKPPVIKTVQGERGARPWTVRTRKF